MIALREEIGPATAPPEGARTAPFGTAFTAAMLTVEYRPGEGWQNGRITPRAALSLDPATAVFHYGQSIFEGLKAHRLADGGLALFRVQEHGRRFARSAERLAMPAMPPGMFTVLVTAFVRHQAACLPPEADLSLYLRPFMFATDAALGVRPSESYLFLIIAAVVGKYFSTSDPSVKLLVSDEYTRTGPGGTGSAKTGGNYAASLLAQQAAKQQGCDQVLWLDACERRWVEEMGGMNIFFVTRDTLVTPPLSDTILAGVTRNSLLTLANDLEIPAREAPVALEEVLSGIESGAVSEAFACGTAAVIVPVGELRYRGRTWRLPSEAPLATRLRERLVAIQQGRDTDRHGWVTRCG
jgi:branched-chain amino acid aminotransferase